MCVVHFEKMMYLFEVTINEFDFPLVKGSAGDQVRDRVSRIEDLAKAGETGIKWNVISALVTLFGGDVLVKGRC